MDLMPGLASSTVSAQPVGLINRVIVYFIDQGCIVLDALFYDVYTQLSELHLKDAGVDIEWIDVDVRDDTVDDRWGTTREYFKAQLYRLPVGKMTLL